MQLLYSPAHNWNFQKKKRKQNITTKRLPHSVQHSQDIHVCNSPLSFSSPDVNLAGGLPEVVADLGGADLRGSAEEALLASLGLGAVRGDDLVTLWVDRRAPYEQTSLL